MSENGSENNNISENDLSPKKSGITRRNLIVGMAGALGVAAIAGGPLGGVRKFQEWNERVLKESEERARAQGEKERQEASQAEIDRTISLQDIIQNPQEIFANHEDSQIVTSGYIELDGEAKKDSKIISYGNPVVKGGASFGTQEIITAIYKFYNQKGEQEYLPAERVDKGKVHMDTRLGANFEAKYVEYNGDVTVTGLLMKRDEGTDFETYFLKIEDVVPQIPPSEEDL